MGLSKEVSTQKMTALYIISMIVFMFSHQKNFVFDIKFQRIQDVSPTRLVSRYRLSQDHRKIAQLLNFRLMAQLSVNRVSINVSLPLGFGEQRAKVARPSGSEALVCAKLRESQAIRRKLVGPLSRHIVPRVCAQESKVARESQRQFTHLTLYSMSCN